MTKPEFSGSLEHAEVMFDSLAGIEGRYRVIEGEGGRISVPLLLPQHRKHAFSVGQAFYSVGIKSAKDDWYWAEELRVEVAHTGSDRYGFYVAFEFTGYGDVWRGIDPERLEKIYQHEGASCGINKHQN